MSIIAISMLLSCSAFYDSVNDVCLFYRVCLEVAVPLVYQERKVSAALLVLLVLKVPQAVRVTRVLKE